MGTPWSELIKDGIFISNGIIILIFIFIIVGATAMYIKGDLDVGYYRTSLDIAIGIGIGNFLIKSVKKSNSQKVKQDGIEKSN